MENIFANISGDDSYKISVANISGNKLSRFQKIVLDNIRRRFRNQ